MGAYYNEIDPFAAQWLRNLIAAGHIAPGFVDERSIVDVDPCELVGFKQCHFFAGIGVWSHALRLAGWPDDREVWTGSCPCQPFSAAGKRGGVEDERHLWPEFFRLISITRPRVVFGEQVASKDGLAWLDIVSADLEGAGYAIGALDTCAAGFGAPHIRQRLYFVADANERLQRSREHGQQQEDGSACSFELADLHSSRRGAGRTSEACDGRGPSRLESSGLRAAHGIVGDTNAERLEGQRLHIQPREARFDLSEAAGPSSTSGLDHAADSRHNDSRQHGSRSPLRPARPEQPSSACDVGDTDDVLEYAEGEQVGVPGRAWQPRATNGFWRDADWLPCIDGKARPVEPGTFPLAHGAPARVGRLRAYGNAICAPQAAEFIRAYLA